MKMAALYNQQLKEQGTQGGTFLSPNQLHIAAECFRMLEPYGSDYLLVQATQDFVKVLRRCLVTKTIAELCDSYEQECRRRHTKGEKMGERNLETIHETAIKFRAHFGEQLICNVRGIDVRTWLMHLDLAPRTRNRHLGAIRTVFEWAKDQEWLPDNPLEKTKGFQESALDKIGTLTVPQTRALLHAAHPDLIPYLAIAAFGGLRAAEIDKMDWKHVHLDHAYLEVPLGVAKTARRRTVRLQQNLVAWLRPHHRTTGPLVPLALRTGLPSDKRKELLLNEARAKASITDWPSNCLRHSYGSYMTVSCNDLAYVSEQMGNSIEMVKRHYRESVSPKEAERYFNIYPSAAVETTELNNTVNGESDAVTIVFA